MSEACVCRFVLRSITSNRVFIFFSTFFLALIVAGGVKGYSPVPFWDMWDGYLEFYVKAFDGDWQSWFAQHNEHRIFLSRILFWIDIALFSGSGKFLIAINYFLLFVNLFVFLRLFAQNCTLDTKFLTYFVICWLGYWIQHENLEWAFQSQFLMAQIIPFCALILAFKSTQILSHKRDLYFFLSLLGGCLSVGTMANGIIVLPLLVVYSVILRFEINKTLLYAIFSVIFILLYFYNYSSVPGHGSLKDAFLTNPIYFFRYIFLYIGGPFHYIFGKGFFGALIAQLSGIFLVISSLFFLKKSLKAVQSNSFQLALLTFLLYIGGTAVGTAGGRLAFGLDQATSSRYMTPALMAWMALLLLYLPALNKLAQRKALFVRSLFFILLILMLPYQIKVFSSNKDTLFEREIAALALELQISDQEQINHIFPTAEWALAIANEPAKRNLSIFGIYPIKDARDRIGGYIKICNPTVQASSLGSLDKVEHLPGERGTMRVEGWAFSNVSHSSPRVLDILDKNGLVVGMAMTGKPRPDVANQLGSHAMSSGFKGYILSGCADNILWIQDSTSDFCLQIKLPESFITYSLTNHVTAKTSVFSSQVLPDYDWVGTDFYRSQIDHMKIFGSFVNSDNDVGSISLILQTGDSLLYRSGPTVGRQFLEIVGSEFDPYVLPLATDWVKIEFMGDNLPKKFEARFSDNGTGWGEWSAIAIN